MTAALIAAWAAVVAALAACVSLWLQTHNSRFALGVDLLFKMDDRFNSPSMVAKRKLAAAALLKNENLENAEDVWDFFETLELLIRRKALDREMVWHTFFYWIDGYWNASRLHIAAEQEEHPTVWADFRNLYRRVLATEERELAKKGGRYKEPDTAEFLKEEMEIPATL